MKKILLSYLIALVLLLGVNKFALADEVNVNLTLKNNGDVVYSDTIPLSPTPSENNVLFVIKQADTLSSDFNISNIINYSFGDYLKCITIPENTELCDNWMYKVNGDSPMVGMDSYSLSGGENIVLYFGDENKAPEPEPEPEPEPKIEPKLETPTARNSSSGSYYRIPIQTILTEPQIIPAISTIQQEATPIIENINLEEKPKTQNTVIKIPKKIIKIEKETLTATAINSVPTTPTQTETPKKNWFIRLLNSIFSIF